MDDNNVPDSNVFYEECAPISQEAYDNLRKPEGMISQQEAVAMYAGAGAADKSEKEQKFVALFKARTIISHIGTMEERRISLKQLKIMKDLGLGSV